MNLSKISIKGILANSADPDRAMQNTASDQGLHHLHQIPVKFLNIQIPAQIAVIILKFEHCDYHRVRSPKNADGKANSVDPDLTARGAV